tara:strand:- start:2752 stop:3831 length:1080 start_codon:yes stop_codon:yes gene_type:complete
MEKILTLFKQIIYLTFFVLFFFLIINFFVSISWKLYSSYKLNKQNPFPEFVRSNFKISDEEQKILYIDTEKNIKFEFLPFLGAIPKNFKSKFVNFNFSEGRKTFNLGNCEKKILFLGGSTTFGWLSIDNKTIPSEFSKIINKKFNNYCVYNYGLPSFYSEQENNLLKELNYRNIIKPDIAIFVDGINETCHGFTYDKAISKQFDEIIVSHRTDLYKKKIIPFLQSTPLFQLLDRLLYSKKKDLAYRPSNCDDKKLNDLFILRLKLRLQICDELKVSCFTFLQPFGGINGNSYPFDLSHRYKKKYENFKQIPSNLLIDISNSLDSDKNKYSYVDPFHYSHKSNSLIANSIFKKIAYNLSN